MKASMPTDVPCNGCTKCCATGQALCLQPGLGDDVPSYEYRVAKRPGSDETVFLLATKENGECFYLGPEGCTIYSRRPVLCRSFDCRKHYLILPRQDRDNLVQLGLSSRDVFNAGRSRLKSLSAEERKDCLDKREELFS